MPDQTDISTLTIDDEVGSIDDGLGSVFTFSETSNLHAWSDGESSYNETLSLVSSAPTDPAETTPPEGETLPPEDPDITISLTHDETGESTSGLTLETTGSQSYQSVGGTDRSDQIQFSADWESSFVQSGSTDYEASLAWNSNGSSSYSESGSLLTEYLITGSSVSEYDQGFDSSVDGMQASSTEHFTASGAEFINYAVATQVSVIVPTDDGSGNSLDPITTISQSESISVSGNAHAESDVLDLVHWAGDVENTSGAADGSQTIETEGVILDAAIFTQNIFDETYSSTEQISLEYASDTGLTVSGNQTSQSEISGSLDIATDISRITTGADQLSTLGVLTNSFHRTFAGENANSSAYTLTKAAESGDIIAEYLSSSASSWEVTDTNIGTYQESAPTTDNHHILAPVSDWSEYRQLSKSETASIEFDGQTWTLAATGSGSLTSNGIYHSTLPDFVAPANTNEAFSYSLNESLAIGTDSAGVPTENHARQFNFTSSPSEPGEGTYQPSAQMEQLAGNLDTQFKSSAENQANTDGTATPPELSPESQATLRFVMNAFNSLMLSFDTTQFVSTIAEGESPRLDSKGEPIKKDSRGRPYHQPSEIGVIKTLFDPVEIKTSSFNGKFTVKEGKWVTWGTRQLGTNEIGWGSSKNLESSAGNTSIKFEFTVDGKFGEGDECHFVQLFWYDVEGDEEFKLPGRTKNERLQSWKEGLPYVDVPLGDTKEDDSPWYDVNGDGQVMDNEVSIFDAPTLFHNLSDRTHSKTTAHFITFLVCNGKPAYLVRWREVWDKGEGRREIVDHGLPTQREIRICFSGTRDFRLGTDANGKDILIRIPPSK